MVCEYKVLIVFLLSINSKKYDYARLHMIIFFVKSVVVKT